MPNNFDRRQIASMALDSMMDRVETAMPDIGDNFPELATDPLAVKYVHGSIETAMVMIQNLTGWLLDDLYTIMQVEAEIKALYPYRLAQHNSLVAQKPVHDNATMALSAIVERMMTRLDAAGAFDRAESV